VRAQHPDFEIAMQKVREGNPANIEMYVDKKSTNIFNWMEQMTTLDMPWSWCQNKTFLKQSKLTEVILYLLYCVEIF
jgi:hypothetical protein